jgi:hypothetical protein
MRVSLEKPDAPDGTRYWTLTPGRSYEVLGIEGDWLRLLDDRGEPVLFDPACFRVIDPVEPSCWVSSVEEGQRYAYPPEWNMPGFFEDWHDGDPEVRRRFRQQLAVWFPAALDRVARTIGDS